MSEEWDLEHMEPMTDDCLEFIKILYIDFYLHKYNKIWVSIFLTFHIPIWAEQFYQYLKTFDILMMAQYGPTSFIFLYIFASIIAPIKYEKIIRYFIEVKDELFLSLNTASEELRRKILKQAKYTVIITKLSLILTVISYFTYIEKALRDNNWEIIYQVTLFKKYFPNHADILIVIFYASLIFVPIPMLSLINIMVYDVMHAYFQSRILNEYVNRITENYSNAKELSYDGKYQKVVFKRLRFCIVYGASLKRIALECISQIKGLIIFYTLLGMSLVFCFIATWRFIQDIHYPSLLMTMISSVYCYLMIVEVGQMVEDESIEVFYRFTSLPWYTFNQINQKVLLCILPYSALPITFSPFREFPVNRTLIVKFYKVACSIYALTVSMRERIHT